MQEWLDQLRSTIPALNRPATRSLKSFNNPITEMAETGKGKVSKGLGEKARTGATEEGKTSAGIRESLRQWQELNGEGQMEGVRTARVKNAKEPSVQRLADLGQQNSVQAEDEEEDMDFLEFEEVDDGIIQTRSRFFLRAGDLLELS